MRSTKIAGLTLAGALALGVGVPAPAQTSSSTTPTTKVAGTTSTSTAKADREARHAADRADLATRLGVTVAKLDEAAKALALSDVDVALAAGRITAEQATALKAAINAGTSTRGIGHIGHGAKTGTGTATTTRTGEQRKADAEARLTRYLGFLGVSKETYVAAVTGQAKARIDQAVTDGRITAAQAAARKAVIDADVSAGQIPGGAGGRGGHGGHGIGGIGGRGHGGGRGR